MIFRIRKANGQTVYLPVFINCHKFHTEVSAYGTIERVVCTASKIKPECYECSLTNPAEARRKASKRWQRRKRKQLQPLNPATVKPAKV